MVKLFKTLRGTQRLMAEALIRVIDKPLTGNPAIDTKRTMAGDVIVVKPDGWGWSQKELTSSEWRVVRTPMSVAELSLMMEGEIGDPDMNPNLRRRIRKFDLSLLPASRRNLLHRRQTSVVVISRRDMNAIKRNRTPVIDRAIL